jgi:hypothetical protein
MMLLRSMGSLTCGSCWRYSVIDFVPAKEILGLQPPPLLFCFWPQTEGFLCYTVAMIFFFSTGLEERGQSTID